MWFEALTLAASVVAGSIASIAGFGIGRVLTPIFGLRVATNVAVIPEARFRSLVAILRAVLGTAMIVKGLHG